MSGWYPDPTGRFEYRWHNGREWTADVSRDGTRYIDQPGPAPAGHRRGNGLAVAGMVCGITALTLGWVPFVAFATVPLAIVAIVLAAVGLARARQGRPGHGFAVAGIVTGGAGILASVVGIVLTFVFVAAVDDFLEPGLNEAAVTTCSPDERRVTVEGTVTNMGDEQQTYTVEVLVRRGLDVTSERVVVDDVEPGDQATFRTVVLTSRSSGELSCEIGDVNGPPPFGLDPELFDS